ncbi:MAG: hypothetical protein LAN18_11495 [Acidobacteriia bacterium]|nr:hypothetical protein [Terriglobia bacterium]
MKARHLLLVLVFVATNLAALRDAHAQATASPTGHERGFVIYEAFEGSTNSDGVITTLTTSASYNFNNHFAAGIGIPIYFDHTSSSTGSTSSSGIGNVFLTLRGVWKNPVLNYGTSLTGSAPTGNQNKGLSTGHATFDWDNRVEHDFGLLTPFADAGLANSVTDTRYFLRPFTSFGKLLHSEAGADLDLSHSFTLTLSAYDILPFGTQTVFSRFVNAGTVGKGGLHGRVFEVNHATSGTADLTRDNGYTAGLDYSPKPYLNLDVGYTRSVHFALNTISFGVGFNVSSFLFRNSQSSTR